MKKTLLFAISLLLLSGCRNDTSRSGAQADASAAADIHPGKKLMETNCYLCHSPAAPEQEGRIGPPMVAVKAYYMQGGVTQDQFTKDMLDFLRAPDPEKAKMKEAVERYGLMPYQHYSDETVAQIAAYLYEYQVEEPEWFAAHPDARRYGNDPYRQSGKKAAADAGAEKSLQDIGLEYALETKKILGKNLMEAIQSKGALHALEFCNVQAIPLTDSMSRHYNADIRRVSDRYRNPANKADAEELEYIARFKKQVAAGEEPTPVLLQRDGIAQFYYPIVTNTMCLQCHGKSADMLPELRQKIATLYPGDLATGYAENEVRGIWSIRFK